MTERIKLTEDDICVVHSVDNNDECIVKFTSLEGEDIIWTTKEATQLKQQILEDHDIAEKARSMINYGDAVELMEWIKNYE